MFVLGIDPGLSTTGYGVVEHTRNGTVAVAAGVIRTDSRQPLPVRLLRIHDELSAVIEQHRPDEMAVEDLFNVTVREVRTQNRKGKPRRYRFRYGKTKQWKKAIVTLDAEDRIQFF